MTNLETTLSSYTFKGATSEENINKALIGTGLKFVRTTYRIAEDARNLFKRKSDCGKNYYSIAQEFGKGSLPFMKELVKPYPQSKGDLAKDLIKSLTKYNSCHS